MQKPAGRREQGQRGQMRATGVPRRIALQGGAISPNGEARTFSFCLSWQENRRQILPLRACLFACRARHDEMCDFDFSHVALKI